MEYGFIVLACVGLVFVLVGVVMMLIFQKGNRTGEDVQATILSTRVVGMGKTARHFATLQYDMNEKTYTKEICTDTIRYREKGASLIIGIDPRAPEKVHLRRGRAYVVFYVLGGLIALLAAVLASL